MASRRFPDAGVRYAIYKNGDRAKNAAITYYLDAAGQVLAPVFIERGTDTPDPADQYVGSTTTLDAFGGQVDFRGPTDGTKKLYAQVGEDGPIFEVPCKPQDQIDALEAAVAALEEGVGEAATADDLGAEAQARAAADTALDGRLDKLEPQQTTISAITRDGAGRVTAFTVAGVAWTITRDGAGRVTGYTVGGTPRTVNYDAQGVLTGVS